MLTSSNLSKQKKILVLRTLFTFQLKFLMLHHCDPVLCYKSVKILSNRLRKSGKVLFSGHASLFFKPISCKIFQNKYAVTALNLFLLKLSKLKHTFLVAAYCICENSSTIHLHIVSSNWAILIQRHKLLIISCINLPVFGIDNCYTSTLWT